MRVLLIGAGAGFSTKDVEIGYYEAFKELIGDNLSFYLLDRRLHVANKWLKYQWRHFLGSDPERAPTWPDTIYRGGIEALEMALRFDVDFVFIISAMYLHPDVVIMMRRAGRKVGVLLTESPYQDEQQTKVAELVDVVYTNERTSVPFLRKYNSNTHYLPHAYSPWRHTEQEWIGTDGHDVVFVGTGFQERIDLLSSIDWKGLGIDLGLYGTWSLVPPKHKLRKYIKGGILTNMEANTLYRQSKIGLNLYRTSKEYRRDTEHIDGAESLNPRAYELAASGTFCLTDFRLEGHEVFGISQQYFFDARGLGQYVMSYLESEEARKSHIEKARELVQGHTFVERAKQVLERAA